MVVGTNPVLLLKALKEMFKKKLKNDKSVYGHGKTFNVIVKELTENPPSIRTIPDL